MGHIKTAILIKDHWKEILIGLFIILLLPLLISVFATTVSSVPAVNNKVIKIYKDAAEIVGKNKVSINWQPLVAIDAVRFKQDFSKSNLSEAKDLANKFILEEKKEIRYNFQPYADTVDLINKNHNINIDWRNVLILHSITKGESVGENDNEIENFAKKFIKKEIIEEKYIVYEVKSFKEEYTEEYQEWEYHKWAEDLGIDFLLKYFHVERLGQYVTKTRVKTKNVEKEVAVEKINYKTVYSDKSLEDVFKEEGYIKKDIPNKFSNKEDITINMINKYEIIYKLKDLETVLNELNFSEEEKKQVDVFLRVGLAKLLGNEFNATDGVSGVRYNIPRMYQYDQRWASQNYGYGTNIKQAGCGPSSFAMIATGMNPKGLSALDKNGDGIVDPSESASWSLSQGFRVENQGTSWGFFEAASKLIGINVKQMGKTQEVYESLKNGYPVIASMAKGHFTTSGHFIVLTGLDDDGMVIVNDPMSESRSLQTWDFNSVILMEAVQFWVFDKPMGDEESFELTAYTGDPSENGGEAGRYAADGKTDLWKMDLTNRLIAVDPRDIKLGKKVYVQFAESKRYVKLSNGKSFDLNGVYTAVDTGGDIKNRRLDLYVGFDGVNVKGSWYNLANQIGRTKVKVFKDY